MKIVKTAMLMILALSVGVFGVSVIISLAGRDASAPVITSDTDVLEIPCDYTQDQLMAGLSASDAEDGDLTDQIVAGSFSRFVTPGVTSLTYVVFDSGNQPASLTREVHFTDYHGPRFTLSEPLVFREQEGSYTEAMERLGAQDQLGGVAGGETDDGENDKGNGQDDGDHHQKALYDVAKQEFNLPSVLFGRRRRGAMPGIQGAAGRFLPKESGVFPAWIFRPRGPGDDRKEAHQRLRKDRQTLVRSFPSLFCCRGESARGLTRRQPRTRWRSPPRSRS